MVSTNLLSMALMISSAMKYVTNFRSARFTASFGDTTDYYLGERFDWKCEAGILSGATWEYGRPQSISIRFNVSQKAIDDGVWSSKTKFVSCSRERLSTPFFDVVTWGITPAFELDWNEVTISECKEATGSLNLRGNITRGMSELYYNYTCEVWWNHAKYWSANSRSIALTRIQSLKPLKESPRNVRMRVSGQLVEHNELSVECTSEGGVPPSSYIYEVIINGEVWNRNHYGNFTLNEEARRGVTLQCRDVNHLNHPRPETVMKATTFVPTHFGYKSNVTLTELNAIIFENLTLSCLEEIAVDEPYDVSCYWLRNDTELHSWDYGIKNLTVLRRQSGIIDEYVVEAKYRGLKYHYITGPKKLNYTWIVQWVDPPPRGLGSAHMIFGEQSILIYIMIAVCTVAVIGGLIAAAIVCRNRREENAAKKPMDIMPSLSTASDETSKVIILNNHRASKDDEMSHPRTSISSVGKLSSSAYVTFKPGTKFRKRSKSGRKTLSMLSVKKRKHNMELEARESDTRTARTALSEPVSALESLTGEGNSPQDDSNIQRHDSGNKTDTQQHKSKTKAKSVAIIVSSSSKTKQPSTSNIGKERSLKVASVSSNTSKSKPKKSDSSVAGKKNKTHKRHRRKPVTKEPTEQS